MHASLRSAAGLRSLSPEPAVQSDAADDAAVAHTLDFVGLLAAPARHIRLSVGALQYGEPRERQIAAMTFAFLAKKSRELCESISELQGILPLTRSLTAYTAEPATLRSCLVALRCLARAPPLVLLPPPAGASTSSDHASRASRHRERQVDSGPDMPVPSCDRKTDSLPAVLPPPPSAAAKGAGDGGQMTSAAGFDGSNAAAGTGGTSSAMMFRWLMRGCGAGKSRGEEVQASSLFDGDARTADGPDSREFGAATGCRNLQSLDPLGGCGLGVFSVSSGWPGVMKIRW